MAMAIISPVLSGSVLPRPSGSCVASRSTTTYNSTPGIFLNNFGGVRKNGSSASSRISRKGRDWWVASTGGRACAVCRRQVYSSYSGAGTDFASAAPIDVQAEVRTQRIVILGGNGFVGSAIAKEAVNQDIEVVSLSRSGRPSLSASWLDKVTWIAGDVFATDWDVVLQGATAVVSTLGGFGTNEQMEKLNGDANIEAVDAAKNAGIKKFILISVHDYNLPDIALRTGYFTGKRRAEERVLLQFPETGTILRPGFIYGSRRVNGIDVPLNFIGEPLEKLLAQTEVYTRPFSKLPAADLVLAPPVSVKDVALATLQAMRDDDIKGILSIEKIKEIAATVVTE